MSTPAEDAKEFVDNIVDHGVDLRGWLRRARERALGTADQEKQEFWLYVSDLLDAYIEGNADKVPDICTCPIRDLMRVGCKCGAARKNIGA